MTPASSILHWMASHGAKCGVVVKQCEDDWLCQCRDWSRSRRGARHVRDFGGGFALMTEAMSMAGMIEVPVVIIEVQQAGPQPVSSDED
jgi:2-oxoglutarate ferredoxin oxidoreductase subunit alpha